ncbi:Ig-like domain repeat protein [Streptomyces sp. MI02-7b]|uniref:Ig-like domain repeat protein n=1 Tax=Streptomyces sp. MI02-7b TaxID=462941 RepID=UPI0029A68CE2|nr:Ig-like domain repeat protein [Streptomyces sp. MI02-7b]MDX3076970.1 Ig-like domain repeat protein [Streptomyces sp. MI02-7b]
MVLSITLGCLSLLGATTTPAAADSVQALAVPSFARMVVDGVRKHVFISSKSGNEVLVTDYDGTEVGTLTGEDGAYGLALAADSSTLYVALSSAHAIAAVDTATLTETARYDTGAAAPVFLALAGGTLYFGYDSNSAGNLGSVDIGSATPTATLGLATGDWSGAPLLAASPTDQDLLIAAESGGQPPTLRAFDLSSGTPSVTVARRIKDSGVSRDLAISADGTQVVTAGEAYKTSDLTDDGQYANGPAWAVAVAPDGTIAAGLYAGYSPDVYLFHPGTGTQSPLRNYDFGVFGNPGTATAMAPAGLAWAPDGSRLFAVTVDVYGADPTLRILESADKFDTALTVNAPATAPRVQPLTLTGRVTSTRSLPADGTVSVIRRDTVHPGGRPIGTATIAAGGAYSFTDTPQAGGKVTYTVAYLGDDAHTGSRTNAVVQVSRTTPSVSVRTDHATYGWGTAAKVTAHLGATGTSRVLSVYATPAGGSRTLIKSGRVNASGNLTVDYPLKRNTTFTASFDGDDVAAPKAATSRVGTTVKLGEATTHHYRTEKLSGQTYYVFHKATNALLGTTMTAATGRKAFYQVEFYHQGAWHGTGTRYVKLSAAGKVTVTYGGDHARKVGYKLRWRSSYIMGAANSGDSLNTTSRGAWKYFTFTK